MRGSDVRVVWPEGETRDGLVTEQDNDRMVIVFDDDPQEGPEEYEFVRTDQGWYEINTSSVIVRIEDLK